MTAAGLILRLLVAAAVVAGAFAYTRIARAYRLSRHDKPPAGFELTGEVFTDPTTGRTQRVWYNADTGERRYETIQAKD
jgi:hypothetical protein